FICLLSGAMVRPAAAQQPAPATTAPSFADLLPPEATTQPTDAVAPDSGGGASSPATTGNVTGFFATIGESICGKPDPNTRRSLPIGTLCSEGWNEAWVPSPGGSGGAPRQGWINAADGNLYRLWFFTFNQGFNQPPKGNSYRSAFTIQTPLSRRLVLI